MGCDTSLINTHATIHPDVNITNAMASNAACVPRFTPTPNHNVPLTTIILSTMANHPTPHHIPLPNTPHPHSNPRTLLS